MIRDKLHKGSLEKSGRKQRNFTNNSGGLTVLFNPLPGSCFKAVGGNKTGSRGFSVHLWPKVY